MSDPPGRSWPLEPSPAELRAWIDRCAEFVCEHVASLPAQPSFDLDGADALELVAGLQQRSRIARYETRTYDWDALKFQADFDPKYRRAQMRYVGTGGTGIDGDNNAVPAEHFTFSTMVLPPGCEGPLHVHHDVEEVFFMIRGEPSSVEIPRP